MGEAAYGVWAALALGFLLGLKHATDADHVVAVTTIASEHRSPWRGLWVGASWGLGHTTPLLALGVAILLVKEALLGPYEAVAPVLEFGVGAMLVFLGLQVFANLRRRRLHVHSHAEGHHDDGRPHMHIHATHRSGNEQSGDAPHAPRWIGRPTFRAKSYWIGIAHGLAGSAAVMLVLLPLIESLWVGVLYLLMFGAGTIVSMGALTIILGVPFALTGRAPALHGAVAGVAGAASVAVGLGLMLEIATGATVIPL